MNLTGPGSLTSRLTTILFDWDDTLANTFSARVSALDRVFRQYDLTDMQAAEFLRNLKGTSFEAALTKLQGEIGLRDNLFDAYRLSYWTKSAGEISLYTGVKRMLEMLKSRGFKLGIVTQKGRDIDFQGCRVGVMKELEELAVADFFQVVVGMEDTPYQKPHPSGLNLAIRRLGVRAAETLFVGDTEADINAAIAGGCWSCYATWGIRDDAQTSNCRHADFIARSPEALSELDYQ